MPDDAIPMTYFLPLPELGDSVWVPEPEPHHTIAVITSDPNPSGRVRLDWDDTLIHQHRWGYYNRIELEIADGPVQPSDGATSNT
jgi:hypothetical protein